VPGPEVGEPLPRGDDAYVTDSKWHDYVLADDGHGGEWRRVFRVEKTQSAALWEAIAELARTAPVTQLRSNPDGFGCGIEAELSFNDRTATVRLGWFYDHPDDPPRLVTAYPTP
jgi:hypothetical protein